MQEEPNAKSVSLTSENEIIAWSPGVSYNKDNVYVGKVLLCLLRKRTRPQSCRLTA